jgi:hypothetical protein
VNALTETREDVMKHKRVWAITQAIRSVLPADSCRKIVVWIDSGEMSLSEFEGGFQHTLGMIRAEFKRLMAA